MSHKHICLNCDVIIAESDFDCEFDADHDFELCAACTTRYIEPFGHLKCDIGVSNIIQNCKSGNHCPDCFNAGYDAGLNGISQNLRDAAPELLEALRGILSIVNKHHSTFG